MQTYLKNYLAVLRELLSNRSKIYKPINNKDHLINLQIEIWEYLVDIINILLLINIYTSDKYKTAHVEKLEDLFYKVRSCIYIGLTMQSDDDYDNECEQLFNDFFEKSKTDECFNIAGRMLKENNIRSMRDKDTKKLLSMQINIYN